MDQAESTGTNFEKDGGRNGTGKDECVPQNIEYRDKLNPLVAWTTSLREVLENVPVDSTEGALWGPVDVPIRRAFSFNPINRRSPSGDKPSKHLLSEDQIELSSPKSSSSRLTSSSLAFMYRTSLPKKRAISSLCTPSRTLLPSLLSPPKPVPTVWDTESSVTRSSPGQIGNLKSIMSPTRSCASGEFKRPTSGARRASNWATPPTWTTPGPIWKRNAWRDKLLRSYSPPHSLSSPSIPPRSAYSVLLRRRQAKEKAQCRDRKGKGKQRSKNSNLDEYAGFKSVEHHATTEDNNWYRQRDSAWSINDKSHGPNIVFPRRFDDPNFNRLNEWWWSGKIGATSHLGLGGWLNTDLLNANIQSLKRKPKSETTSRLGRNSGLPGLGVGLPDKKLSLCSICGSDGHKTRQCECCDACFAFGHAAEQCPLQNRHWMQDLATFGLWNGDIELMAGGSSNDSSSQDSSSSGGSSSKSLSEGLSPWDGGVEGREREWW